MTHTHSGACLSVTHYVWHISSWTWHRCHVDNRLGNRLHLNEPKTSHFFRSPLVSRHHIWILYHLLKNIKWTNYNTHSLISIWLLLIILSIVLFVTDILFLDVIYGLLHHKYGHRDVMLTCSVEDMRVLMSYPLGYITDMAFVTSYRYVLWHSCLDVMSTLLHHRRVHHDVIWLVMSQSYLSWRHVLFVSSQIWPSSRHICLFCHRYAYWNVILAFLCAVMPV